MCHQDSLTPARTSCLCPPLSLHFLLLSLALGSQGYLLSGLEGEPTVGWLLSLVWGRRACPLVQPGPSGVCHPPPSRTRACLENWLPPLPTQLSFNQGTGNCSSSCQKSSQFSIRQRYYGAFSMLIHWLFRSLHSYDFSMPKSRLSKGHGVLFRRRHLCLLYYLFLNRAQIIES